MTFRYLLGILSPLLCSLLRCIIDHHDNSINLTAVKLSRVCEAVVNFLFVQMSIHTVAIIYMMGVMNYKL